MDGLSPFYGSGARSMQDHFDSRRLADRLSDVTVHDQLTDADVELIEAQSSVIVSTVDSEGWPDVSYKGGVVGFVRVVDRSTLELPSYDGNGMFRTLGNISDTGRVALLFIDTSRPFRMRLHGIGTVLTDEQAVGAYPGAQAVVRITLGRVFPNCGRYVHQSSGLISEFAPRPRHEPPVPEWKTYPIFVDVLPRQD